MKEISHLLRAAYLSELTPFIIEGVTIPIFDQMVNPNVSIPTYRGANSYIIILDQNEVETTNNDCSFRQSAYITFDIVTKFSGNVMSSLPAELISNKLQQDVKSLEGQVIAIQNADIQVLDTVKVTSRTFIEEGASIIVVRRRIIFSNTVYQS